MTRDERVVMSDVWEALTESGRYTDDEVNAITEIVGRVVSPPSRDGMIEVRAAWMVDDAGHYMVSGESDGDDDAMMKTADDCLFCQYDLVPQTPITKGFVTFYAPVPAPTPPVEVEGTVTQ